MKFFHLSDLHIGKHLHHYNLKEDQEYILQQIVECARNERPDCIVIAGDIYDKAAPSGEAVSVFDAFLTALSSLEPAIPVLIISGNHDSARRLDYASNILNKQGIYIAGMPPAHPEEYLPRVTLTDDYGEVDFYLLPFVKPAFVRGVFGEEPIDSYHQAVQHIIEREQLDNSRRSVLVSHQFYTAGEEKPFSCDSEMITVGGVDNVDISAVEMFDYVALGHIHGAQQVGHPHIRYCGTPLKYSVSESRHQKSITVVTLREKGSEAVIETILLKALRDVRQLTGTLQEVLEQWDCVDQRCQDFVSVTLTDETELYKPKDVLSTRYQYIMELKIDNTRTRSMLGDMEEVTIVTDPLVMFGGFFEEMQGRPMTSEEADVLAAVIQKTKEGDED